MLMLKSQLGVQRTSPLPPRHAPASVSRRPPSVSTFNPQRSAAPRPLSTRVSTTRPAATGLDKFAAAHLTAPGFHQDASLLALSGDAKYAVSRSHGHNKAAGPQQHGEIEDPDVTRVWDLKSKCVIWQGDLGAFTALTVAVDPAAGRYVFCNNRSLLVWPMDEDFHQPYTVDSGGYCNDAAKDCSVALSADGLHAVNYGGMMLRVWDLQHRRCLGSVIKSCHGRLRGVCVSADQCHAAVAHGGELLLLDLESCSSVGDLPGTFDWTSFTVTADGRYALSAAADPSLGLQLWDLKAWYSDQAQPLATLKGMVGPVRAVAVGEDQRVVSITGDSDDVAQLHVWDSRPWWQRMFSMAGAS